MTKIATVPLCAWCRRPMRVLGRGRPRRYCRQGHRQRAYEARVLAERLGMEPETALVPLEPLRRLGDLLYALETAVEDVEGDLEEDPSAHAEAFEHLYRAARALHGAHIEPIAAGEG